MRTTGSPRPRGVSLALVALLALAGCAASIRTSTIRGHRVLVDASRGAARTTLRIDECAARELRYDTDFVSWGLEGELDGALFESPEAAAEQLIATGYSARCGSTSAPRPTPPERPLLADPPPSDPASSAPASTDAPTSAPTPAAAD